MRLRPQLAPGRLSPSSFTYVGPVSYIVCIHLDAQDASDTVCFEDVGHAPELEDPLLHLQHSTVGDAQRTHFALRLDGVNGKGTCARAPESPTVALVASTPARAESNAPRWSSPPQIEIPPSEWHGTHNATQRKHLARATWTAYRHHMLSTGTASRPDPEAWPVPTA